MKFVQILIKVPPVNSEVLVDLKNIESPEIVSSDNLISLRSRKKHGKILIVIFYNYGIHFCIFNFIQVKDTKGLLVIQLGTGLRTFAHLFLKLS
jgi:hypothetical protein